MFTPLTIFDKQSVHSVTNRRMQHMIILDF